MMKPAGNQLSKTVTGMFIAATLAMNSCQMTPASNGNPTYFDLSGFLDQQVETLYKDSFLVLKTSSINLNTDQHEMPWTDWRKELSLFYASDINKVAYSGKYKADTIFIDSTQKQIVYRSTDPKLRTSLMEITFTLPEETVKLIHINNQSQNIIYSNTEDLYLEPLKTYIIKSKQQMILFGVTDLAVKGDFVQKQRSYF
ncbi:MAG: hypothetical protein K1X61_01810 [Chitinophagales bacterium]|nr:hypothetical protein [Chitinophagales bacterium]